MLIVPYQADVAIYRYPYMNIFFIVIITLTSIGVPAFGGEAMVGMMILDGWNPIGLVGHAFLHGGFLHLLGNMIFLWAFGNAVCGKIGNISYLFLFLFLAVASGSVHNLFDGATAIGASGAVNGVVGMFLVYFPRNEIQCFWWIFFRGGTFSVSSIVMILIWLAFDIWGVVSGGEGIAYWGHIGGIATGVAIGVASLHFGWVKMSDTECSLLDMLD